MTAAELLARITSHELSEWQALYRVEDAERQIEAEQPAEQQPPDVPPSLA